MLEQISQIIHILAPDSGSYHIRAADSDPPVSTLHQQTLQHTSLAVLSSVLEGRAVEDLARADVNVPRRLIRGIAHELEVTSQDCGTEHVASVAESD
jgi:hypothetical protein